MAAADVAKIFDTIDQLTDNQLRMVKAYASDLLAERATQRGMARRALQNVPPQIATETKTDAGRRSPQ